MILVVAADDGVMPQTREHLAVLSLLGLTRGAVVVAKADRADAARVQAVQDEAEALLHGTPLAGAPVLAVSAQSGDGLDALRALLFEAARNNDFHGRVWREVLRRGDCSGGGCLNGIEGNHNETSFLNDSARASFSLAEINFSRSAILVRMAFSRIP